MNYIVADGNIREVLYLLSFSLKGGFLPAFFFPSAEDITLGDQPSEGFLSYVTVSPLSLISSARRFALVTEGETTRIRYSFF